MINLTKELPQNTTLCPPPSVEEGEAGESPRPLGRPQKYHHPAPEGCQCQVLLHVGR